MKVHLRKKQLSNSNISLYLDFCLNGRRHYEFLKMYLTKGNSPTERHNNQETMKLTESIRAKRQLELQSGIYGLVPDFKRKMDFLDYFESLTQKRKETDVDYVSWFSTLKHLKKFIGNNRITVSQIDERWLEDFKEYLIYKAKKTSGDPLSQNSAHHYFNRIKGCLKQAYRDKIIIDNPGERVDYIKQKETQREYLTAEELQKLAKTECRYEVLKKAFLFSSLTGLRWSDIQKLTWSEIHYSAPKDEKDSGWSIHFKQKKTEGVEYHPISKQAKELLGNANEHNDKIFIGLKYSAYLNVALARWVMAAGINKKITFHCGKHTNATLLLSNGVDIYTVSKLLHHRSLKTTQIYAKVIDQKKIDAVNSLPEIKL